MVVKISISVRPMTNKQVGICRAWVDSNETNQAGAGDVVMLRSRDN